MSNKKQEELVPKILWLALLSSHLIFIFITHTTLVEEGVEFNRNGLIVFSCIALTTGFLSLFFKIKSYRAKFLQYFFPPFIISMAMAESVHIFGVVGVAGSFIQLDYYYFFMGAGILLHLNCFPQISKIGKESFE